MKRVVQVRLLPTPEQASALQATLHACNEAAVAGAIAKIRPDDVLAIAPHYLGAALAEAHTGGRTDLVVSLLDTIGRESWVSAETGTHTLGRAFVATASS